MAEEPETKAKKAENEEYGRKLRDQKKIADSIHTQYQELKAAQHHLRDEMVRQADTVPNMTLR